MSSTAADVFDPELALERCFDNPKMVRDMIACFLGEVDGLLQELHAILQKGDSGEIGCRVHRAEPASEAASRVERSLRHAGEQVEVEEAVRTFESECEDLEAVLTEYQAATGPRQGGR